MEEIEGYELKETIDWGDNHFKHYYKNKENGITIIINEVDGERWLGGAINSRSFVKLSRDLLENARDPLYQDKFPPGLEE